MDSGQVVARGAWSNASSFVIRFAARASFLWIAARLYGAVPFGVFSIATAFVELAVPLASLGLKRMIFPWLEEEAPARRPTHVLLDALLLAIIAGCVVATAFLAISVVLPAALVSPGLRFGLMALAPAVLGQVVADIAFAATRWTHRMRYEVIGRGLVEPYVLTAAALGFWAVGRTDVGLLAGYWLASGALALFALWGARHCLGPLDARGWQPDLKALVRRARVLLSPAGSDALTMLAQRIDLFLVGFLLGDAPAGVYGVLRQLRTPILQVRQSFDGILTPLVARTMRADGDVRTGAAAAAATRVILTIQLALVLLMAAAGGPLLGLFGHTYAGALAALVALNLAETITGAFGVSEMILYYRRPARALQVNLAMIAVPVVLTPLLTPRMGVLGAALAMLAAALVAAWLRRHWLKPLGVLNPRLHAAAPVLAALAGAGGGLAVAMVLPGPSPLALIGPALAALAIYGIGIRMWTMARPGALSMADFRVR